MSKIQEVTAFMRDDVAKMNEQAEALLTNANVVKANFEKVVNLAKDQLSQADKDLAELVAALVPTNSPPT